MQTKKNNYKQMKLLRVKVTPMTFFNLFKLAKLSGFGRNIGRVIDKLVREKMLSLHTNNAEECNYPDEQ